MKDSLPTGNPFANLLVIIAGVLLIGVSIVVSVFAFAVLGAVILVAAALIGLRIWWVNRRLGRKLNWSTGRSDRVRRPDVIEGEYREVRRKDREQ